MAQRAPPVDHKQPLHPRFHSPLHQIRKQRRDHGRVLGGALLHPEYVLVSIRIDADGDQDVVAADHDTISIVD
jgi:hypothetical protein